MLLNMLCAGLINERDALKDHKGSSYVKLGQRYLNDNISNLERLCKIIKNDVLGPSGKNRV